MSTAADHATWVTTDDGQRVPQSSDPAVIDAMLELLDLHDGHHVLEIGTGSGYSTALLSNTVGTTGHVVSVDVDGALVERARRLHHQAGHANVEIHLGDGYHGWAGRSPYDRIIAWTTPHVLPQTWAQQASPQAVIVTPVKITDVANANAVLRCRVHDSQPFHLGLHRGSFIDMHGDTPAELRLPGRYVDATHHTPEGPHWISGTGLHHHPNAAAELLRALAPMPFPFQFDHHARHNFRAWLLATHDHAATAGDPTCWGFGLATPHSVAVTRPDGTTLHAGTPAMLRSLNSAAQTWHDADRPGYNSLHATAYPNVDGWTINATWAASCPH